MYETNSKEWGETLNKGPHGVQSWSATHGMPQCPGTLQAPPVPIIKEMNDQIYRRLLSHSFPIFIVIVIVPFHPQDWGPGGWWNERSEKTVFPWGREDQVRRRDIQLLWPLGSQHSEWATCERAKESAQSIHLDRLSKVSGRNGSRVGEMPHLGASRSAFQGRSTRETVIGRGYLFNWTDLTGGVGSGEED